LDNGKKQRIKLFIIKTNRRNCGGFFMQTKFRANIPNHVNFHHPSSVSFLSLEAISRSPHSLFFGIRGGGKAAPNPKKMSSNKCCDRG
jgi:hypothetical protein